MQRGFNEAQAIGISEAIQQIDLAEIASKGDIQRLENRIDRLESMVHSNLRELELRMTIKLGALIAAGIAVLAAMNYFSG